MVKIIESNLQIKLIALGLLFIMPLTIHLGLNFAFPKTTWNDYQQLQHEYLQNNMPNYEQYQDYIQNLEDDYPYRKKSNKLISSYNEYVSKWESSHEYKDLKEKDSNSDRMRFILLIFIIIALMAMINCIPVIIIRSAFLLATVLLFIFKLNQFSTTFSTNILEATFMSVPLPILGIATSLVCLILALYASQKDQI